MIVTTNSSKIAVTKQDLIDYWVPPMGSNKLRSIDLFAGAGGLSLGLHASGWEPLFAVEKDPMAFETLRANLISKESPFYAFLAWPEWVPKTPLDIGDVLNDEALVEATRKTAVDLVAGGPPCQGFSVGGARRGELDKRNDLPFRFVDFIARTQPRTVLLENVEGFDKPFAHQGHNRSYADIVSDEFRRLGYKVTKVTVHADLFGVPQTRRRVLLFGVLSTEIPDATEESLGVIFRSLLKDHADRAISRWLGGTKLPVGSKEAISDLSGPADKFCRDAPKFKTASYLAPTSEYQKLMRVFSPSDPPDSHRFPVHTGKVLTLIREAQSTQKAGRLPQEFLRRMGTRSRKKVLLDPDEPISTLTSHPDEFFHYDQPRILTLRETARLQGFPDRYEFHGRYTLNGDRRGLDVSRCAQVGNAIPPLMARAIGLSIADVLSFAKSGNFHKEFSRAAQNSGQLGLV